MKKVLVVLMLLPLFFCCNDDEKTKKIDDKMIEDTAWKEKTYKVKIEVTDEPNGVFYYHGNKYKNTAEWQEQKELNDKRDYIIYTIKPTEEEVSFVVFEGGKKNDPKFTAKLYVDDKFVVEGQGVFDGNINDILRFVYNFKTPKVVIRHDL